MQPSVVKSPQRANSVWTWPFRGAGGTKTQEKEGKGLSCQVLSSSFAGLPGKTKDKKLEKTCACAPVQVGDLIGH